jgi:hypothetical protein
MPLKVMVFIDGCWFYHSRQVLFDARGEDGFEIDYKRLPLLVQESLAERLDQDVDVVRTCYFGTLPVNKTGYNPAKQRMFYEFLAAQCGFDTEVLEIDHRVEHGLLDDRCVGVALAASLMQLAAIPGTFDIATIVGGNIEYRSLMRKVRAYGRRTHLVAIRNREGRSTTSPTLLSELGLFDLPPLYLDEHIDELRLVRKEQQRACKVCGVEETTTWAGPEFFCARCRTDHRRRIRVCDTCGREEETTWDKDYFYCSQCRRQHRGTRTDDAAPAVATGTPTNGTVAAGSPPLAGPAA